MNETEHDQPASDRRADPPVAHPSREGSGELDLFAVFMGQRLHLRRTLALGACGFIAMLIYGLLAAPRFSSTAVILIPPPKQTAESLIQRTSGLDLLGGGFEIYIDIMKSHTVAMELVKQNDLLTHYKVREEAQAEAILTSRTAMEAAKEGMLRVTVQDSDPNMAANLANGYIKALDHLNQTLAITSASQHRAYFEQQMILEKNALADAEVALKQIQEHTGVLVPDSQAIGALTAVETTRAQLRARQVELGAMLQGATQQNPDVQRVRAEIASLEEQLRTMQSGTNTLATGTPVAKEPSVALDYVRAQREVKFHEALFEMLARQFESAKEDESKNMSIIEILDVAIPAKHKSWPPRTIFCLLGGLAGIILGILYTLLSDFTKTVMANPENQARLAALYRGAEAP